MANTTSTDSDSVLLNQIVNQGVNIYGSREKIRAALIEYAKTYLNLKDVDIRKTSYLAFLIDQLSILSANHIFYDSTIYKEFFFTDAQLTESVHNLAKWIGYVIPKATPAQLKVLFEIPLTFSGESKINFTIPPHFYVRTDDGIPFIIKSKSLDSEIAASGSANTASINIAQRGSIVNNSSITIKDSDGVYQPIFLSESGKSFFFNLTFVQKEISLYTFEIPNDLTINQFHNIDIEYNGQVCDIDVYVISPTYNQTLDMTGSSTDGALNAATFNPKEVIQDSSGSICRWEKWEEAVNGVYTLSSKAKQYCWVGGYNKGTLMFGNGILGKQPAPGSIVAVMLHVTRGSQGNIIPKTIVSGDPIYTDVTSSTTLKNNNETTTTSRNTKSIKYKVLNYASAYGGDDLLTLPEIKQKAIINLSSKKRLVSEEDYNNIKTILGNDLPVSDCLPILKRSDIKTNEIMTFTTLNYITDGVNEVVPTRNARLKLTNIFGENSTTYAIPRNYKINGKNSNVGNDNYLTLFNMILDENSKTASYDYILQNLSTSAVKAYSRSTDNYYEQFTYMGSNGADFNINISDSISTSGNYPLDVTFNVNHTPQPQAAYYNEADKKYKRTFNDNELTALSYVSGWNVNQFQCKMITKWGNNDTYDCTPAYGYNAGIDEKVNTDGDIPTIIAQYKSFKWTINNYLDVPEGMQRFEFQLQCYAPVRDSNGNILDNDGNIVIPEEYLYESPAAIRKKLEAEGKENTILQMGWHTIRTFYTDTVIRRNLDNFMTSSLTFEDEYLKNIDGVATKVTANDSYDIHNVITYVHNVPVILQKYYEDVIKEESESDDSSNFESVVMQELIQNMYFNDKKMLTDFINMKFSDTYGPMLNLRFNTPKYYVESRFKNTPWWDEETQKLPDDFIPNPDYVEPDPNKSNVYYIVNNHIPASNIISDSTKTTTLQLNDYIGYIALRVPTGNENNPYNYQLFEPTKGMYIRVKDELDMDDNEKTLVWTGRIWKDVLDYTIPLEVKIKVEVDESVSSKTDESITSEIIDALTEYFKDKMGIQKSIDRSEIIKVCRSITGVIYTELIAPEFDIKFDYEIKDLNEKQLLDYTPQYVGFRGKSNNEDNYNKSTINVQIVRV